MFKFLLKHKWYLCLALITMFIAPSITSWGAFYLQGLFNDASAGADKLVLIRMLTILFLAWMGKRFVEYTSSVLRARFLCSVKQDVKHEMFVCLINQDAADVASKAASGDYISSFTNDINIIEQRYFSNVFGLVSNIISIVILGASFFTLNKTIAAFVFAFAIIPMTVPLLFAKKLSADSLAYSKKISSFTQRIKEYFTAYQTIKNYSIDDEITDRFDTINEETEDSKFSSDYTLSVANNIGSLLSWFIQFVAVGIGLILLARGEILIGTIIAARAFTESLGLPFQEILININSIRSVNGIVKKIHSYIERPDNTPIANKNLSISDGVNSSENRSVSLLFSNINLSIGNNHILSDFTFCFEAGKKYLVIGKNGAGKSSVFRVLKRFLKNASGNIYVDGKDVRNMSNDELSRYVSYLNENVSLFSTTIKDNIQLYQPYEPEALDRAVQLARMDLELDRAIKDGAGNVSSGEKRRIEIARSLLRNSPILIFDEVISTLDIETAYEMENMILHYPNTVIMISHNFSGKLIRTYDEVLVMEDGELVAHGPFERMIEQNDYFKRICDIKFGIQ